MLALNITLFKVRHKPEPLIRIALWASLQVAGECFNFIQAQARITTLEEFGV
jgi:hypothetical protein